MPCDFRVEWCSIKEETPITKTPVLVFSERFRYGFNVCLYDGVSRWIIDGSNGQLWNPKADACDLWAYLPDID